MKGRFAFNNPGKISSFAERLGCPLPDHQNNCFTHEKFQHQNEK